MLDRRGFLKRSSLIALAPTVPGFLAQAARAIQPQAEDRVLVVIQLDGGNDGINTVVPFADEGYGKHRDRLRLKEDELIKLTPHVGLHPALRDLGKLWESQRLAIVQGVGYPNPNRSHDASMAIWQTCRFDAREQSNRGWLGRALDELATPADRSPAAFSVGDGQPPIALRGRRSVSAAIDRVDDLALPNAVLPISRQEAPGDEHDLTAFVRRSALDAYATADRFSGLADPSGEASYPGSGLAQRLRLVARLLKAGLGARVYYAVQSGYDTHAVQLPAHDRLLRELSGALYAFLEDLRQAGLDQRVVVMCFSEFGRRVVENGSMGTDHGTAGPVLLAGPCVRPGLHAAAPSLVDLEQGDVKMSVDFRQVYASLLQHWLGTASATALGGEFAALDVLQPAC